MRTASRSPERWSDAPPASDRARAVASWGSRRGRLPWPRAVRLADDATVAWAHCVPPEGEALLVAWEPESARTLWRVALPRAGVFDVSPDGARLLFTDPSGACLVLDARRGIELARFTDAPGAPAAVALARAPAALLARNGRVRAWRLDGAAPWVDAEGEAPLALHPDGTLAAWCNRARTRATLVDALGRERRTFAAPRGAHITALDLRALDALALGFDDGRSALHPLAARARAVTHHAHGSPVRALCAAPDTHAVARGHDDGTVATPAHEPPRVWSAGAVDAIAAAGASLHREPQGAVLVRWTPPARHDARSGHADAVTAIALTADGRRALTASRDGTLRLWDTDHGEVLATLEGHAGPVRALALSRDGRAALSVGDRDGVRAWSLADLAETAHVAALPPLDALALSPDGTRLLAAHHGPHDADTTTLLLDAHTLAVLARARVARCPRSALGFSADGLHALLAWQPLRDGGVRFSLVHAHDGSPSTTHTLDPPRGAVLVHRITDAGDLATATTTHAGMLLHDLVTGELRARHAGGASLLHHPHVALGDRAAVGSAGNGRLDLCDLRTGRATPLRLAHRHDQVTALALSPDERWFVAGTALGLCIRYELRADESAAPRAKV